MSKIFVDASHFVALLNKNDELHTIAANAEIKYSQRSLVTTEDVLTEVLNFYCEQGEYTRKQVAIFVRNILLDIRVEIMPHTSLTFLNGLELYESRLDKGYSLTDCISMNVCEEMKISDVLSNDSHFRQEGFNTLL